MGTLIHCFRECTLAHALWRTIWKQAQDVLPLCSSYPFSYVCALEKRLPGCTRCIQEALLQPSLLSNARSALPGVTNDHFSVLTDLERAQGGQLL